MTSFDFGFSWSKVKVTRVLFCYKWFELIVLITVYHRAIIIHKLIGLDGDMAHIDFGFTRLKVKLKKGQFCKKITMVSRNNLKNRSLQSLNI